MSTGDFRAMEHSNSNASTSSQKVTGPFAYQTRLLERTSSTRTSHGSSGLSRNNSQSGMSLLTGNAPVSAPPRRWTPTHRIGASLDAVRAIEEQSTASSTSSVGGPRPRPVTLLSRISGPQSDRTSAPPPIIASPVVVASTSSTRIHIPTQDTPHTSTPPRRFQRANTLDSARSVFESGTASTSQPREPYQSARFPRPANSFHSPSPSVDVRSLRSAPVTTSSPTRPALDLPRPPSLQGINSPSKPLFDLPRPPALYDASHETSQSPSTPLATYSSRSPSPARTALPQTASCDSRSEPASSPRIPVFTTAPSVATTSVSSVMSPSPYRSTYMASKYGNALVGGRRLGRHLPRIASGDTEEPEPVAPPSKATNADVPKPANADDVAGVPGRIRLSRNLRSNALKSSTPTPLPSAKLSRGLWADVQRHLLQAYEYLCHVGEAQQWIEGCLGEELGFGIVEMEEGLRNGIVLAKLVRVFQGESVVRRIYKAPKLDFRHSDNINIFFTFVRTIGLPECFIFELTDLYNKKNIPKVIYCIHALSHLLARRGMAERIGNLLGALQFSDDQLQQTHKGLKDAGVSMPNFGDIGKQLAREINEEPEEEVETEEEARDRMLLENETSILALQSNARGYLARKEQATLRNRMHLSQRHIPKLQAMLRGTLVRNRLQKQREKARSLLPWVVAIQATLRGKLHSISHARGVLLLAALRSCKITMSKFQSMARAAMARQRHCSLAKTFSRLVVAASRGALVRRVAQSKAALLVRYQPAFVGLQAQCRGMLMRRGMHAQMAKLEDVSSAVIRIQAAARTYLARRRLLNLIRGFRRATPIFVGFQARARANLARQRHTVMHKALADIMTIKSVGSFQAMARASLARHRHQELNRRLEFVAPDVLGIQAAIRGALVRHDYIAWRDHLWDNEDTATYLQAMLRGVMQRQRFKAKIDYYRANLTKIVKIQSLFRAKGTREQYRQLTLGTNVTVGTIKNFVHLLDDSEADFQEEIKVERLRKKVVEAIRENQQLEADVSDLDVKIALVVENVKSFEDVIKSRRFRGDSISHATRSSLLAAHGDPFSGPNTLDHEARRKLELYQQLFHLLQTRGEYLARLFLLMSREQTAEADRRFIERVVLTLFGYGQDRRENFLLLKMFSFSIREEMTAARSLDEIINGHPMYMNVSAQYVRPKQVTYVRDTLQSIIRDIIQTEDLDLETDPCVIHRSRIELEETRTGVSGLKVKDVTFLQALEDPDTRPVYIRHLQVLQWWTEAFITALTQSTRRMPYSMRYLARETLLNLQERFPNASDEEYAICIGRLVFCRYINPAIISPETFDIVNKTVGISCRKNLAQVSKVLAQINSGQEFGDNNPSFLPINVFVNKAIGQLSTWFLDIANVPDAETELHAHEFLDATVQPKPIYISPNEIYTMHGLLAKHQDVLSTGPDDVLKVILHELNGIPHLGSDELKDARDAAITLELTNRFADVRDPHADEKALWVKAKRGVLAILRVQPAQDLIESLMRPVTEEDETAWEDILEAEMENEQSRANSRRQPSAVAPEAAYRLEDVRSLDFGAVKALAISYLLELEKQGKISREDGFQGILNAIALDVRSKHRRRIQRQQEMDSMDRALKELAERKKDIEEQLDSYHNYVQTSLSTMQRSKQKKRVVLPFTKQYFHLRHLQKTGQTPQFGSYIYTAKDLYDRGILLMIDQYSPRQYDKIQLTMSSNTPGVFTIVLESSLLGPPTRVASEDIRIEDLLQAKYEKRSSLSLFGGKVKVNFEEFLFQINKK
ncbi:hypothetical protein FISHEDRAFT_65237 [Fistulina hepatica ATCC 64428]|nr:hypothetical protein FISHEDRAFT_65237 [Fistulina hepatica ATCC 64428]